MKDSGTWQDTCAKFRHIAAVQGVQKVADAIPAGRDTVYRLLKGETTLPTKAVQAGITKLVNQHTQDQEQSP